MYHIIATNHALVPVVYDLRDFIIGVKYCIWYVVMNTFSFFLQSGVHVYLYISLFYIHLFCHPCMCMCLNNYINNNVLL